MKQFLSIMLLLCTGYLAQATTYYFSQSGDDTRTSTQAQNSATPWKNISKLTTLVDGDIALLKCNDTFPGNVVLTKAITINSYGTGWKPLWTGFVTATSWTSIGSGIYESNVLATGNSVNMVVINGKTYAMGRYPNSGYLTYEGHTTTSITDNEKPTAIGSSYAGGFVVIRGNHFGIERQPITSVSGNTISFAAAMEYTPTNGYGYFVENSINALDQFGEWYYNPATHKIDVYFGSATPTDYTVQASAKNVLIEPQSSNITINNIRFEGANSYALWNDFGGKSNLTITNCRFTFMGADAISMGGRANVNITNSIFAWCNNNGTAFTWHDDRPKVTGSTFRNIGLFPGMYTRNDSSSNRYGFGIIDIAQSNSSPTKYYGGSFVNNVFKNIGYSPIFMAGDSNYAYHNVIDSFCSVMDDGGGIYTGNAGADATIKSIRIIENVIQHGIGAAAGTTGGDSGAEGVYCDDNSINVSVIGNTIAHTQHSGIYLHNARKCTITDNRCYNNAQQLAFQHDHVGSFTIDSNIVKRNEFFAATAGQLITSMQKSSDFTESFASWATFDNNKYCAPLRNEANIIYTNWFSHGGASEVYYNLGTWKTFSGQDASTTLTPQTVTDPSDIIFDVNVGNVIKRIGFCADCISLDNILQLRKLFINPFGSVIIIKKH